MRRGNAPAVRAPGLTLVELLVVLAMFGLLVGVTGLAFTSLRTPRASAWNRAVGAARARAIRDGRPVALSPAGALGRPVARFLPDGRAIGSEVDPLSGAPLDVAR